MTATRPRAQPGGPVRRHRQPRRGPRRALRAAATSAALCAVTLGVTVVVWRLTRPDPVLVCGSDALQAQVLAGLSRFSGWLDREGAAGFVGEVGWPSGSDAAQWDALADVWYTAADAIGLPVAVWSAGPWPARYRMAVYHTGGTGRSLDTAGGQASIVQRHPGTANLLRGVNVAGGSFGTDAPGFSTAEPGSFPTGYDYGDAASYAYLAGRGIRLVRLAVSWERVQRRPFDALEDTEVGRVRDAITQAGAAGLSVVLDLHGYGDYATAGPDGVRRSLLGSADLPAGALADLWSRLATATADLPAVIGYGLLNEPSRLPVKGRDAAVLWEGASQRAVDAIRRTGSRRSVLVAGYARMAPGDWGTLHPHAWIRDPAGRTAYEAHDYFDEDNSGRYRSGYADEAARAPQATALCQQMLPMTHLSLTARRSA